MKNYWTHSIQYLALTKILQNFRKTSIPLSVNCLSLKQYCNGKLLANPTLWLEWGGGRCIPNDPFTLGVSVCVCVFENNGTSVNKIQMKRMDFNPIFYVNVHVSIETMIKFNANGNVDVDAECRRTLRARLHQASSSTLWPLCDDASDSVLIENNGDAWKWVATLIPERHRRVVTALTLTFGVNGHLTSASVFASLIFFPTN